MGSGLAYEAEKLRARISECEEAFGELKSRAENCSKVLMGFEEGSCNRIDVLKALSSLLEALGRFEHELSHLYSNTASILTKLTTEG